MDNALSGYISINESADSSNGLFTEEEQEDRETDIRMLPTLTSKIENTNKQRLEQQHLVFIQQSVLFYDTKVAISDKTYLVAKKH